MADKPLNPYFLPPKRGLNPYFSYMGENYSNANEQNLINSLVISYIQQFGFNVIYLCRTPNNMDKVFGESAGSNFKESFEIEMMMESYEAGFGGRDQVQQFGYFMHDDIELHCSFSRINEEIEKLRQEGILDRDNSFPQPGDLVYIPLYKCVMEIRFVESKDPNQPLGMSPIYKFTCHMYNPNSETFSTGIPDIDIINEFNKIYNEEAEGIETQKEADDLIEEEPNAWKTLLKQG